MNQLCASMFGCICENLTYTHKHRHAAMWNATLLAGWLGCRVAVGVSGCDPGISVFVLCHSPSLWGRWQSSSAWGDETWDRQSLVVNNNSFMRQRRLPAAFKDLRERQRFSGLWQWLLKVRSPSTALQDIKGGHQQNKFNFTACSFKVRTIWV